MPAITYGPTYFRLPSIMQVFTTAHECGHLVLQTNNEFEANCYALANAGLSAAQKAFVARYHKQVGLLPEQYGGNGEAFWDNTVELCSDLVD
ncbi:hypothetical protein JH26_09605 [Microvirga sp. BSC39]|nr:hypothetical protein JH26_09605 [Microvirga sp. BSC39]